MCVCVCVCVCIIMTELCCCKAIYAQKKKKCVGRLTERNPEPCFHGIYKYKMVVFEYIPSMGEKSIMINHSRIEPGCQSMRKTNATDVINSSIMLSGKYILNNHFTHKYLVIQFFKKKIWHTAIQFREHTLLKKW